MGDQMKSSISAEHLRSVLAYDPKTGEFKWLKCQMHSLVGKIAGSIQYGYRVIAVGSSKYQAHRLAWLYVYGEFPEGVVDHINGIQDDNRIANLRVVAHKTNMENMRKPMRSNKLGVQGVHFRKDRGTFKAEIKVNGKSISIGTFKTASEAHQAYIKAKRQHHEGNTL